MGKISTPFFYPDIPSELFPQEDEIMIDQKIDHDLQNLLKSIQSIDIEVDERVFRKLQDLLKH